MMTLLRKLLEFLTSLTKSSPKLVVTPVVLPITPVVTPELKKPTYLEELIVEARKYIGTKEEGTNAGVQVIEFQKAVNGKASRESWCMCFVQYLIKKIEEKNSIVSPVFKSEHVQTVWAKTPIASRIDKPEPGCIICWKFGETTNGHAGIVEKVLPDGRLSTIEGNTSEGSEVVREGDGVYERNRSPVGSEAMKVLGFIKPF